MPASGGMIAAAALLLLHIMRSNAAAPKDSCWRTLCCGSTKAATWLLVQPRSIAAWQHYSTTG
jgi:hypothetical protein